MLLKKINCISLKSPCVNLPSNYKCPSYLYISTMNVIQRHTAIWPFNMLITHTQYHFRWPSHLTPHYSQYIPHPSQSSLSLFLTSSRMIPAMFPNVVPPFPHRSPATGQFLQLQRESMAILSSYRHWDLICAAIISNPRERFTGSKAGRARAVWGRKSSKGQRGALIELLDHGQILEIATHVGAMVFCSCKCVSEEMRMALVCDGMVLCLALC